MNTKAFTILLSLGVTTLTGCFNGERSVYAICDDNPQLCSDIEADGWCTAERALVIRQREVELITPSDQLNLYNGLAQWKDFSQCIENAASIKRRNLDDRDSTKEKTYLVTLQEIKRIENATVNSELPQLIYYHWAQNGDENKIKKLVKLDKQGQLNTFAMQQLMAAYYGKTNKNKAIQSQYKALSLLTQSDLEYLPPTIYASLATHAYQIKDYPLAYVWSQIAIKAGLKESKYNFLTQNLKAQNADINNLQQIATQTYESILALKFQPPEDKIVR